jgi:hypothetical protein
VRVAALGAHQVLEKPINDQDLMDFPNEAGR